MEYEITPNGIEWDWEDGSFWTLDWFRDSGCFSADRWLDEDRPDPDDDDDGCVIGPGDYWFVESLEALEEGMGRPLPTEVHQTLQIWSEAYPFTDEDRAGWTEWNAFAITRKTPEGDWIETFAPPGDPEPFAYRWIPESTLWEWGLL